MRADGKGQFRRTSAINRRWNYGIASGLVIGVMTLILTGWLWLTVSRPPTIQEAEELGRAGDWNAALLFWRKINATSRATSRSHLGEARACLAMGRAAWAERSLRAAIAIDSTDAEPWRLLLKILRMENRIIEAQRVGWLGYNAVTLQARRELLSELTLALLADLPDDLVRVTLKRWSDADRDDVDSRVALLRRFAIQPRAADPDRQTVLISMEALLAAHPHNTDAREMLVSTLADSGELARGQEVIDAWPEAERDARYWNLRGRWQLEYDHQPDQAVISLERALSETPQDWRAWYRLARALSRLGRNEESLGAAERVKRLRELLDPLSLGSRLDHLFEHLNTNGAVSELAEIADRAGLAQLASAWRNELND